MKILRKRIFNRDDRVHMSVSGASLVASKDITGVTVTDGTNTCTHNLGKYIDFVEIHNSSRVEVERLAVTNSASPYNSFTFDCALAVSLTNCTLKLFFKN